MMILGNGFLPMFAGGGGTATFQCTTLAAGQTLTINSLGVSAATIVDWGDGSQNTYTSTALRTHVYTDAGAYTVTILNPLNITIFDIRDSKVTLNSRDVRYMKNVSTFLISSIKGGAFNSADVSAWRPTIFYLHSMPSGYTGAFNSADISAWRPTNFRMSSMPSGYIFSVAAIDFAGWTTTRDFQMQSNAFSQAQVNAVLWGLYQASTRPRTATGGAITIDGSNAAPSGVFQAPAACPVAVSTPGKEVAHALLNDGCAHGFNKWNSVAVS